MNVDQAEIVLRNLVAQLRKDGQSKAADQTEQAVKVIVGGFDREEFKRLKSETVIFAEEVDELKKQIKELESDKRDEYKESYLEAEIEQLNDQLKSREPSNLYDEQKREITDALFNALELPTLEEIKTYYL